MTSSPYPLIPAKAGTHAELTAWTLVVDLNPPMGPGFRRDERSF